MRVALLLTALSLSAAGLDAQIVAERCLPDRPCPRPLPPPIGMARIARTQSEVRVTLEGRVLRYEITESFVNRGGTIGEADYVLPLPRGATFEDLALEIDGELVTGETLDAGRARGIYEEIVRKVRDPALVEWMGHGMLRTRIFPIAPGETKVVVVRYRAVAPREGNALRVEYLGGGRTPGSVESVAPPSLTLVMPDTPEFGAPFSPTHQIDITTPRSRVRVPQREVHVRGDASRLTLLVPVRDAGRALVTVLPYAPLGEDGFALITLSPPTARTAAIGRDITLVLDVSGSMAGAKMDQAREAGRTLVASLTARDRFRLIAFATDVNEFRDGWSEVTPATLREAQAWLGELRAVGSTNIQGALDRALAANVGRDRLGAVLFLTDGAATVGERNPERLAALAAGARGAQRVFTFGVGADVQTAMLERIAIEGRGTAHFVQPNEDIEHAVGVVAQRLTAPVATNVRLVGDGVVLRHMQPQGAQDVFAGQDLAMLVRYRGAGSATLTFVGDSPHGPVRWTERVTLPAQSRDNAFVAKLWAAQRVGWLSAERRRNGANPELDAELRELGTKYGVPTELTSYLVLEPGMQVPGAPVTRQTLGAAGAGGGRAAPVSVREAEFAAARVAADQRAAKSLADVQAAAAPPTSARNERADADGTVRHVGERTFVARSGMWTDTRTRDSVRRVTVKPFSAAYFSLIERVPELAQAFALGERVTVSGRAVVIVLDAQGATSMAAADLASVVRDW